MFKLKSIICLTLLLGLSTLQTFAHEKHERHRTTDVLDVVFAPMADPEGSKFIVDNGSEFVFMPPFEAGSRFLFTARIYPGHTFSKKGPFAHSNSLIHSSKILGLWICDGVFTVQNNPFTPPGNVELGKGSWAMRFDTNFPPTSEKSVQTIFAEYTVRSVNPNKAGTGKVARLEIARVIGGVGLNFDLEAEAKIETYLDLNGNLLLRFKFSKKVILPRL